MAKKKDKRFNVKRHWLNPPSSSNTGYIISGIEKDGNYVYGKLKIADCSKIIELDIYVDDSKQRKEALKKISTIQNALDELVTQINLIEEV